MKRILIVILTIGVLLQVAHAEDTDKEGSRQREERREDRNDRRNESKQREGEKKPLVVIRKEKEKEKPN